MNAYKQHGLSTILLVLWALLPLSVTAAPPVQVTSADPASAPQGTISLDVAVGGSGFDDSAAVMFLVTGTTNPGGITVKNVAVLSSKKLIATVEIADTAVVNNFDIQVQLSGGRKGKGTSLFAVLKKPGSSDSDTSNQCIDADSRGFPSFVFTRQTTINGVNTWGIYIADDDAQCEKLVGSYPYSRDVDFSYDTGTATGLLVHSSNGTGLFAATLAVSFNADGSPVVQASAFQSLLPVTAVPDPQLAGWGPLQYIGSAEISHDRTAILFRGTAQGTYESVIWTCPLNVADATVNPVDCQPVYRSANLVASWGARDGTIYLLKPASSGSGTSLYRLTLATNSVAEVWSRGTLFTVGKATLDSGGSERVAVYEPDLASLCSKVLVIDADSCADGGNNCNILNGGGHPARSLTWLPNTRLAGEGQTAPSRKGKCAATGTIVTFDATDTNGTTTTLNQGFYPNGAGGG